MSSATAFPFRPRRESGAVLVISLAFLLLLTLIGVSAMQTTTIEEKMAGNLRDRTVAFEATEAALRIGERRLAALIAEPIAREDCSSYATGECLDEASWGAADADGDSARWSSETVTGAEGTRYHLRYLPPVNQDLNVGTKLDDSAVSIFHVTACSEGVTGDASGTCSDDAKTIIQTTYRRRF